MLRLPQLPLLHQTTEGTLTMTTCNEIVAEWKRPNHVTKRYVCTAERETCHTHSEGLAAGTLRTFRANEHETMTDEFGCSYLADRLGNRVED